MRKLFSFMMATADGYYEGPNQEFDWPNVDEEFNDFAVEQLEEVDTLLFGRVTYETMAAYWPTPAAEQDDARVVERMNNISKIVASRTLDEAGWTNTRLVTDVTDELGELKSEPGKDIAIFGSSNLTASLLQAGLVDELPTVTQPFVA
jgi:dihydrofolate reductase